MTNGTTIHVRVGGGGSAVVLLHGYGETGDMWGALAADLVRDRTVVVPDLRGMGLSSKPDHGFDKRTQAGDVVGMLDVLKIGYIDLVTHDIGNMVGFAFAAEHRDRVTKFVLIDAPLPGGAVGGSSEEPAILAFPLRWAGYGAAGGRPRAHLSRPLLERVLSRPQSHHRSDA